MKWEEQKDCNSNGHINTRLNREGSAKRVWRQLAFAIVPVMVKNKKGWYRHALY